NFVVRHDLGVVANERMRIENLDALHPQRVKATYGTSPATRVGYFGVNVDRFLIHHFSHSSEFLKFCCVSVPRADSAAPITAFARSFFSLSVSFCAGGGSGAFPLTGGGGGSAPPFRVFSHSRSTWINGSTRLLHFIDPAALTAAEAIFGSLSSNWAFTAF